MLFLLLIFLARNSGFLKMVDGLLIYNHTLLV